MTNRARDTVSTKHNKASIAIVILILLGLVDEGGKRYNEFSSSGYPIHCRFVKSCIVGSNYRSFAYSALACFRMGMSGSASFQSVKKS
jgi:hypothetical protein